MFVTLSVFQSLRGANHLGAQCHKHPLDETAEEINPLVEKMASTGSKTNAGTVHNDLQVGPVWKLRASGQTLLSSTMHSLPFL